MRLLKIERTSDGLVPVGDLTIRDMATEVRIGLNVEANAPRQG